MSPAKKTADVKKKPSRGRKASIVTAEPTQTKEYIATIGRRKEAVARVRMTKGGTGRIMVNDRAYDAYFPVYALRRVVETPLTLASPDAKFDFSVRVAGGGLRGQADAVRLGIARALLRDNPELRVTLRKAGLLTRDARVKERKKYGLKKARRAPQWQKR